MLNIRTDVERYGIDIEWISTGHEWHKEPWMRRVWVRCRTPWEQFDRNKRPGTYIDAIDDGDVGAFIDRYRRRYPC